MSMSGPKFLQGVANNGRDNWPFARGWERRRSIRVGLSRAEALQIDRRQAGGIPRGRDSRGSRGTGTPRSRGLERARNRRSMGLTFDRVNQASFAEQMLNNPDE